MIQRRTETLKLNPNFVKYQCPKCKKEFIGLRYLKIICEPCNKRCVEVKCSEKKI